MRVSSIHNQLAVIGAAGYWGSKVVVKAGMLFGPENVAAIDTDVSRLHKLIKSQDAQEHRWDKLTIRSSLTDILSMPSYTHFFIATPPETHYKITQRILEAGRHVMVAKPMTLSVTEATTLEDLAIRQSVKLMVDNTFLFHPAIRSLTQHVRTGQIGLPTSLYAEWLGRGKISATTDVIWDLAPHPLSILLELWRPPISVACYMQDSYGDKPMEVTLLLTEKATSRTAVIRLSWLDGHRSRLLKVRGTHHTIIFDDTKEPPAKLVIKGGRAIGHPLLSDGYDEPILTLDYPEEYPVEVPWEEPLKRMLLDFVAPDREGAAAHNTKNSVTAVRLMEAAHASIQQRSATVLVDIEEPKLAHI